MPYETGTASGPNDLLDKLRIFAAANGWTVDFNGPRGDGLGQAVLFNRSGLCAGVITNTVTVFSADDPGPMIETFTYPGPYSGAATPLNQSGRTQFTAANNAAGPYQAYHFFIGTTYVHVVVEVTPGRFTHFGFGALDKAGGGAIAAYNYGLRWNFNLFYTNSARSAVHGVPWTTGSSSAPTQGGGAFRCDSDGISPRNYILTDVTGASRAIGGWLNNSFDLGLNFMRLGPSAITGRTLLVPPIIMVERTTNVYSVAGTPRDLRILRIDNLAPGEVMTIGSDQWKVFPVIRKNGPPGVESSANDGFAYRMA